MITFLFKFLSNIFFISTLFQLCNFFLQMILDLALVDNTAMHNNIL